MKKKIRNKIRYKTVPDKIPEFTSYEEETRFWDTHNITDFEEETENVDVVFELRKPRDERLILRLQKELKERLKHIARSKGLNVSTLARMWLMEKLQQASR